MAAPFLGHANNAVSTIANVGGISGSATSVSIQTGDVGLFPASGNFNLTLWPTGTNPTAANCEIVTVTAGQGTSSLTITRAQESTTAKSFNQGDNIGLLLTKTDLTNIENLLSGQSQGAVPYVNSSGYLAWLAPGTSGQVLQTQGASANPQWSNSSAGFNSGCYVYSNSGFNVTTSTDTVIQYANVAYDLNSEFNNSTYLFTAKSTGYYLATFAIHASGVTDTHEIQLKIYHNASSAYVTIWPQSGSTDQGGNMSAIVKLSATDTLGFYVYHNVGSTVSFGGNQTFDYAMLQRIF